MLHILTISYANSKLVDWKLCMISKYGLIQITKRIGFNRQLGLSDLEIMVQFNSKYGLYNSK